MTLTPLPGASDRPMTSTDRTRRPLSKKVWFLSALAILIAAIGGAAWLYAGSNPAGGTIGPNAANPVYIVVNTPTVVTFTSKIADPKVRDNNVILVRLNAAGTPADIIGRLKDDGKNGDVTKNDNVYTLRLNLNEPVVGVVQFKVAARFKPAPPAKDDPDDDWDTDLASLNDARTMRDRPARLLQLIRKFLRYQLSEPFQVTVWRQFTESSGLQLLYPPGFSVSSGSSGRPSVVDTFQFTTTSDPNRTVIVTVYSTAGNISINSWFNSTLRTHEYTGGLGSGADSVSHSEQQVINGHSCLFVSGELEGFTASRLFCSVGGRVVEFENIVPNDITVPRDIFEFASAMIGG